MEILYDHKLKKSLTSPIRMYICKKLKENTPKHQEPI